MTAAVLCGVPAGDVDSAGIAAPVVAMAGVCDADVAISDVAALAHGAPEGRLVVLERVGGPAPLETPEQVAAELVRPVPAPGFATIAERTDAGMAVCRAVLGDAHVDRATAAATDLTRVFQHFITDYAWGGIWTRTGPSGAFDDHPHGSRGSRPSRGAGNALARGAHQRAEPERDPRAAAPDRHLLRRARRQ